MMIRKESKVSKNINLRYQYAENQGKLLLLQIGKLLQVFR